MADLSFLSKIPNPALQALLYSLSTKENAPGDDSIQPTDSPIDLLAGGAAGAAQGMIARKAAQKAAERSALEALTMGRQAMRSAAPAVEQEINQKLLQSGMKPSEMQKVEGMLGGTASQTRDTLRKLDPNAVSKDSVIRGRDLRNPDVAALQDYGKASPKITKFNEKGFDLTPEQVQEGFQKAIKEKAERAVGEAQTYKSMSTSEPTVSLDPIEEMLKQYGKKSDN